MRNSTTLDGIDRALIHALHIDGRAPFTRIAEVLDVSTQTVTRRYQRLRVHAALRVVGLANPAQAGRQQWIVRLTAAASAAQDIAYALARRVDTSWVRLTSGGTEIVAIIDTVVGDTDAHALLLRDVPRTSSITAVSAHYLLHTYLGGPTAWRGRVNVLTPPQEARLRRAEPGDPESIRAQPLGDGDARLMAALLHDGRASYHDLAGATGWSAATVARRLADLRTSGVLFFDVDIDSALLGVTTQALLWMSVAPAHLDRVARDLAGHDELAAVAATTGRTNLLANALATDGTALHRYLTERLALEAITTIETAPILATIKGAGPAGMPPG